MRSPRFEYQVETFYYIVTKLFSCKKTKNNTFFKIKTVVGDYGFDDMLRP